jgi:4-alpha-glucanotransferase
MKIDDPKILERSQYHKFCQWLCDASWKKIKRHATKKKVMLLGDLPFSISRQSADVWQHPERFSSKWNAGAPPEPSFQDDEFVRKWGQNWGLPLYDWEGQKKLGHPWWKKRLEILARYFHGYRLDHALGYFRVYAFPWNPSQNSDYAGKTPEEVCAEGRELPRFFPRPDDNEQNKLINLENGRRFFTFIKEQQPKMLVVAEDLGLVPDYVRPFLEEIAVPGMKIPHFERLQPDLRYQPVDEYPACSLATWATHDHPPLAALWRNWQQKRHHSGADEWEVRCFLNFIGHREDSFEQSLPEEIHFSAIHKISSSRSSLLCLQLTDWFKLEIRYNLPGLQSNSNWSARLPFTVDALFTDKILKEKTQKIKSILLETDRIQSAKKVSKPSLHI